MPPHALPPAANSSHPASSSRPPPLLPVQSLDGTGNNPSHPDWGSAGVDLLRRAAAAYADGLSAPSGADRPSGRTISNALAASPADGIVNNRSFSAFV